VKCLQAGTGPTYRIVGRKTHLNFRNQQKTAPLGVGRRLAVGEQLL
jgi:hypothetical protein